MNSLVLVKGAVLIWVCSRSSIPAAVGEWNPSRIFRMESYIANGCL